MPKLRGAVRREALLDLILGDNGGGAVLLQAPAGHGKTTLLHQLHTALEAEGWLCGWLTVEEGDNDTRRFTSNLLAVLQHLEGRAFEAGVPPGTTASARLSQVDWFIQRLLDLGRPIALIVDEFNHLHQASVLQFFRQLLERCPDGVRILIGSRAIPNIGLSRLVVNRRALILRAEDLRFSPHEVDAFFAQLPELQMTADEVEAIRVHTEGWPAALQLYRLSLARPAVRESLRRLEKFKPAQLAQYLADNVLALQPPDIQEFLLKTSLSPRVCARLCNALLDRTDSQAMLEALEAQGMFLGRDGMNPDWFRYHALCSDFMAEQLESRHPQLVAEIHRRAATWFQEQGHYEEALHHAFRIPDYARAAEVLDLWSEELVPRGDLMTIERWSDRLPLSELSARPRLVVKVAWALAFLRRHQKLIPLLKRMPQTEEWLRLSRVVRSMMEVLDDNVLKAAEIVEPVNVDAEEVTAFQAFELAAAANLKGFVAMGEGKFEVSRGYLAQARARSEQVDAPFSWGYAVAMSSVILMSQGQLREATTRLETFIADPRLQLDDSVASATLSAALILALYEAGQLDQVELRFKQYIDILRSANVLDFVASTYSAMARTHDARGRDAEAEAVLEEAEVIAHNNRWPRLLNVVQWERVRRALRRGEVERARVIESRIIPDAAAMPNNWVAFSSEGDDGEIGAIRLLIHENKLEQAARDLDRALQGAYAQGRVRRQIRLHIFEALNNRRRRFGPSANRSLRTALQLAARGGFVRAFLDEGDELIAMLTEDPKSLAAGLDGVDVFLRRLLDAAGSEPNRVAVKHGGRHFVSLEPLSEREREVLALLAQGASNKEIARRVFLSENTVKFHLKNVFSKLGVSNRTRAITAGRQLGLIPD